jgi:L-fuconolactonase
MSSIVDGHAHIISSDPGRYPHPPDWPGAPVVDAETLLQRMAAAGVDQAVLVQYSRAHGYDNRYVLDTAAAHPERFVAVCTIDGRQPGAPAQLAACYERGAGGLRIRAPGRDGPLDWLDCPDLLQRAADLDLPVCVHFMESVQAEGLRRLPSILTRFPTLRVVLDHAGNPPWREGPPEYGLLPLLALAKFERLIIKFATINLERLHQAGVAPRAVLGRLVDTFGAQRIMWGSDAPNTPGNYPDMVQWMHSVLSAVSEDDRRWIVGGTARAVYPRLVANGVERHAGMSFA